MKAGYSPFVHGLPQKNISSLFCSFGFTYFHVIAERQADYFFAHMADEKKFQKMFRNTKQKFIKHDFLFCLCPYIHPCIFILVTE